MSAPTDASPEEMEPVILDALNRAAEAHGIHEKNDLGGVYDEQWPEWYAHHMVQTLRAAGYRLVRARPTAS
jgi:hypothetical protein